MAAAVCHSIALPHQGKRLKGDGAWLPSQMRQVYPIHAPRPIAGPCRRATPPQIAPPCPAVRAHPRRTTGAAPAPPPAAWMSRHSRKRIRSRMKGCLQYPPCSYTEDRARWPIKQPERTNIVDGISIDIGVGTCQQRVHFPHLSRSAYSMPRRSAC